MDARFNAEIEKIRESREIIAFLTNYFSEITEICNNQGNQEKRGESFSTECFIDENLQVIDKQLKDLHHQISKVKRQIKRCELSGPTYDRVRAQEVAAREKCFSLQTELMELFDKVQQQRAMEEKYDQMNAANKKLNHEYETLLRDLQGLKGMVNHRHIDDRTKYWEEHCDAVEKAHTDLREKIRDLKNELEDFKKVQEINAETEAIQNKIKQLGRREG